MEGETARDNHSELEFLLLKSAGSGDNYYLLRNLVFLGRGGWPGAIKIQRAYWRIA